MIPRMSISSISASGLVASARRIAASASNIANADTRGRRGADTAYAPVEVRQIDAPGGGVSTIAGLRQPSSYPLYAPDRANADDAGLVDAPNVDFATEHVEQVKAEAAYRASASVFRTGDELDRALLDLKA